jgi:hypothetical protein
MPVVPRQLRAALRPIKRMLVPDGVGRAVINQPTGRLQPGDGPATFVVVVGPAFKQHIPNAMMTCRMGYCYAFEQLGIPYLIVDVSDLKRTLKTVHNPFCMIVGYEYDLPGMDKATRRLLRDTPHAVWVNPWFKDSDRFFARHQLDASIWDWSERHRMRIVETEPGFVFNATVPRGLCFFEQWQARGLKTVSMPLACDMTLYHPDVPRRPEFNDVQLAFVGGYWKSKGEQIDQYLRPFERDLTIYGYSKWPYTSYRGQLPRDAEAALYRQATLCPTINEPTVRLLHGQINERVFKILGAGGATVVDAVPAYRELFGPDELPLPDNVDQFVSMCRHLMRDEDARRRWAKRGRQAVLDRHTYHHRARTMLEHLNLLHLIDQPVPMRKAS